MDFFDAAVVGLEGLWLMPTGGHSTATPYGQPKASTSVAVAGVLGGAVGLVAQNQKQTVIGSAATGLLAPLLTGGRASGGVIALSIITSTAVGMVTQQAKQSWREREAHKVATADITKFR